MASDLRLIRRTSEPVICFTEFRDTLRALVARLGDGASLAVLHGGLDRAERREAVARFTQGDVRVLVATDAAAEGLNLQARCRVLVNVELPWSPRVLEQRAGRIDRIGQRRRVRIWELSGPSGHEGLVIAALARRAAAIASDLEPGDATAPIETAESIVPGPSLEPLTSSAAAATIAAWWTLRRPQAGARDRPRLQGDDVRSGCARGAVGDAGARRGARVHRVAGALGTSNAARCGSRRDDPAAARSPRGWLAGRQRRKAVATAALAADAADRQSDRARKPNARVRHRTHADSKRRWQPSFFDRRAERARRERLASIWRVALRSTTGGCANSGDRRRRTPPRAGARTAGALMPAAIDGGLLSSDFLASGLVAAWQDLPALADMAVRYAHATSRLRNVAQTGVWRTGVLEASVARWSTGLGGCSRSRNRLRLARSTRRWWLRVRSPSRSSCCPGRGIRQHRTLRGLRCARKRTPVGLPDKWAAAPARGRDPRPVSNARL
jgi:hypothetical protein